MSESSSFEELVRDRAGILYARHFLRLGVDLFRLVCEQDLEGIVAKHTLAPYGSAEMPWIKVLNPNYEMLSLTVLLTAPKLEPSGSCRSISSRFWVAFA